MAVDNENRVWFKPFARAGYASRGLIYSVIGFFAVLAALDAGENKGSRDALQTMFSTRFGDIIALVLMCGLISYALWRVVQSLFDTDQHGFKPKGLAIRMGLLASAVTYATLTVYTFGFWNGSGGGGGSGNEDIPTMIAGFIGSEMVARILACIFAGVGIAHIVKAYRQTYARHFRAPPGAMRLVHPVSQIGLTARGLSFLVVAFLFFYRGLHAGEDGSTTPGVEDVLAFLQDLPGGGPLLALMGLGLITFALYSFLQAAWRHINVEDADAPGR